MPRLVYNKIGWFLSSYMRALSRINYDLRMGSDTVILLSLIHRYMLSVVCVFDVFLFDTYATTKTSIIIIVAWRWNNNINHHHG